MVQNHGGGHRDVGDVSEGLADLRVQGLFVLSHGPGVGIAVWTAMVDFTAGMCQTICVGNVDVLGLHAGNGAGNEVSDLVDLILVQRHAGDPLSRDRGGLQLGATQIPIEVCWSMKTDARSIPFMLLITKRHFLLQRQPETLLALLGRLENAAVCRLP